MNERPFRILGIQQVAVGHREKQKLRELWIDLLGLEPVGHYRNAAENVDEDIARLGSGPFQVEIDLMEPIDAGRSPRVHEPALNHVGLWVDDLAAAHSWLSERGVRFAGGMRRGAAGHLVLFIHPKGDDTAPRSGEGVLIELVQAPPEIVSALAPRAQ